MEMLFTLVGLSIGSRFTENLEKSGKISFTKEEIMEIYAESAMAATTELSKLKKEREEKETKETEAYPKPMSNIPS